MLAAWAQCSKHARALGAGRRPSQQGNHRHKGVAIEFCLLISQLPPLVFGMLGAALICPYFCAQLFGAHSEPISEKWRLPNPGITLGRMMRFRMLQFNAFRQIHVMNEFARQLEL